MMNESTGKNRTCPACGAKTERVCLTCSGGARVDHLLDGLDDVDSTPGTMFVGKNGLILSADPESAALLGSVQIALIEKPFTLFIQSEALADFFIHRNALFATREEQNFEIKLHRKDRSLFHAKLKCTFVRNWKRNVDCMRVSIRDYTRRRRALDRLGYKQDIENIISTITTRLIRCPVREIEATLTRELKTLAMFTEVERVYLAVFDETAATLSLELEWYASEAVPAQPVASRVKLDQLPGLRGAVSSGKRLQVADVAAESGEWSSDLDRFHMAGTQSFAYFLLREKNTIRGIIGYDACQRQNEWDPEVIHLFQFAGQAFLNAIFRKHNETAWLARHDRALDQRVVSSGPPADGLSTPHGNTTPVEKIIPLEIEEITETGEIHEIYNLMDIQPEKAKISAWQYETAGHDSLSSEILKMSIVDGKMLVTCPHCMQQDPVTLKRFKKIGKIVTAICPCGFQFNLTPEMRSYYRKDVELEGVFLQTRSKSLLSDSAGFSGKMRITNLSKNGIGFLVDEPGRLSPGDQVRAKFTLDNPVRSLIVKQVLIKNVDGHHVGGQFLGSDRNDITLGFYLM